mmetsp:Transcript_19340/g.39441  ORF Transcript_19340/g.39441 Transcript_19340/m.39441 type:complete len:1096 (+) Transcript_19340:171-3458(+)
MSRRSNRNSTAATFGTAISTPSSIGGSNRRVKTNSSTSTSPMPSTPGVLPELDPRNPSNLKRSLDRNDVELAALSKLHVALRILREAITEEFGEDVLIAIAVGGKGSSSGLDQYEAIKEDDLAGVKQDENSAERLKRLSNAFQIRMKLRRRLLNRLARRLHRVAHILDGQNVVAPYPPLYGDQVRRFLDADSKGEKPEGIIIYDGQIKEFHERNKKLEELKSRLLFQRLERKSEEAQLMKVEQIMLTEGDSKGNVEQTPLVKKENEEKDQSQKEKNDDSGETLKEDGAAKRSISDSSSESGNANDDANATECSKPDGDLASEATKSTNEKSPPKDEPQTKFTKPYSNSKVNFLLKGDEMDEPLLKDMVEYEVGYDKLYSIGKFSADNGDAANSSAGDGTQTLTTVPPNKNDVVRVTKPITDTVDEHEVNNEGEYNVHEAQDAPRVPFFPYMFQATSGKIRADEWKRWVKEMCAKIPDQATFEDLKPGGESHVFQMDLRLKRAKALKRKREESEKNNDSSGNACEEEKGAGKADGAYGSRGNDGNATVIPRKGKVLRRPAKESDEESGQDDNASDEENEETNRAKGKQLRKDASTKQEEEDSDAEESNDSSEDVGGEDNSNGIEEEENIAELSEDTVSATEQSNTEKSDDSGKESGNGDGKITTGDDVETKKVETATPANAAKSHPKSFSLLPVPSFYDQDLFRLKNIHREIIQSETKGDLKRLVEAKDEAYQLAYKNSTDLNNRVNSAQQKLEKAKRHHLFQLKSLREDNQRAMAQAQKLWNKRQWERQYYGEYGYSIRNECKEVLQGIVDRIAIRTPIKTNTTLKSTVAGVLSEMTLSVDRRKTEEICSNYSQFVPPKMFNEHSMTQMHQKLETQLKNEIVKLRHQFSKAEEHRTHCWNALQKAKVDPADYFNPANTKPKSRAASRKSGGGSRSARQAAASTGRPQTAASASKSSGATTSVGTVATQAPPQNNRTTRTPVKAAPNNPTSKAAPNQLNEMSNAVAAPPGAVNKNERNPPQKVSMLAKYGYGDRYSINKVNARKMKDGSVIPVSTPKKLENGKYARPSGRQRKGMDWDAVRGIWVPEGKLPPGHGE